MTDDWTVQRKCPNCAGEHYIKGYIDSIDQNMAEHLHLAHPDIYGTLERANDVQFYSEHVQALMHPQQHKVVRFLEGGCIEYAGASVFICKPLAGYNSTTYRITSSGGDFHCTCQFNSQKGIICSHIATLYEYLAREHRRKSYGVVLL